jgi:selenocysteine lyase/cysteine desulfurase
VYGITDPARFHERAPTIAFTKAGIATEQIARTLGENSIFVWDGHYYAIEVVKRLGLYDQGGMVRVGLAHYNTQEEIDRLLDVVRAL